MNPRTSLPYALRWDLLLVLLLLLGWWSYRWLKEPYFQRAESERSQGSRPPDRTEGDILLMLPDAPSSAATTIHELDCSYGWFNALWQEYGSFASALTRNLSPEILAGRSVVIVPRRVAEALPSTGISALAGFVREGGQLVLEQPPSGWERLTGVTFSGEARKAQQITSTQGLSVHGPMRKHLPKVPLVGTLLPTATQEFYPKGPMLLEIDGQPGWLTQPLGQGRVHTLLFDFGCTVTGLQQGIPEDGMRFDRSKAADALIPSSQRAPAGMRNAKVPYADMLERALFQHFSSHRPLPKLWGYPGVHAGAFMLTHPTHENTRAALGFADWSRKKETASTIFAPSDRVDTTQGALFAETAADVGLLWVRGIERDPISRPYGVGSLQPLRQELNLEDQLAALRIKLPAEQVVRLARVEGTLMTNDWSTTFEQLAHASLRLDASMGPSRLEEHGYLFGSGYPSYPLDRRGRPLPMLTAPFVLHEGSLTRERMRKFLANSQAYFHQPLTISIPAYAMRTQPSAGILLALRDAHELATKHKHWITTLAEWLDFLSARRKSVLTSQWSGESKRLTISLNLLGSKTRTIRGGAFAGVAVPRTFDGEEIERVVLDGKDVALKSLVTSGSSLERILEVGPGRHTISVYYKSKEL